MTIEVKELVLAACEQILWKPRRDKYTVVKLYSGNTVEYYVAAELAEQLVRSSSGTISYANTLHDCKLHDNYRGFAGIKEQFEKVRAGKVGIRLDSNIVPEVSVLMEKFCFVFSYDVVASSNIFASKITLEKCRKLRDYVTSEGLKLRDARESISTVWHKKIAQWLVIIESDGSMSDFYLDVLLSDFTVVKVHCHNNDVETIVCKDNDCLDALLLYVQ